MITFFFNGDFLVWNRSLAFQTTNYRKQVCDGFSICRVDGSTGVTVAQSNNGARITRTAGDTNTSTVHLVATLSESETKNITNKNKFFGLVIKKGSEYTGSTVTVSLNSSDEQEQCIINNNGTYTNGNELVKAIVVTPTETIKTYTDEVNIPQTTQCSVNIAITFSGVAGGGLDPDAGDWIEISKVFITSATKPKKLSFTDASLLASKRFASSYPYAGCLGATKAGSIKQVAVDSSLYRAVYTFGFEMCLPPTVFVYSTLSAQDMEVYNNTTSQTNDCNIIDISHKSATMVSIDNATTNIGDNVEFHYIAEVRL
tara:strand:- start:64385 stop:65326 length:942 start_codon:yes stop_codon:yes gene_type:complete